MKKIFFTFLFLFAMFSTVEAMICKTHSEESPVVTFANGFSCPLGASFETRNEGCEL